MATSRVHAGGFCCHQSFQLLPHFRRPSFGAVVHVVDLGVGTFRFQMQKDPCTEVTEVRADISTLLGAHGGNRTRDLSLTKGVLCH